MKSELRYSIAAAVTCASAVFAAPASADHAAEPCQLGWSNVGPRTCAKTDFSLGPTWTLGDGVCPGMLSATGTSFDGPLYRYTPSPGAVHSVALNILQGFTPLGEWGPLLLSCDVTAAADWHNLDTGRRGSVSRFIPSNQRLSPTTVVLDTGAGRVQVTLRTDQPNIPASIEVFVP
ncbi:hypothetical protein [Nocardia brasiliensis]|uniref:hypothetical protein n=1 Tax=Nocardia brasiliensis TaxID=37326 RepID=UPI002455AF4A|nr:hypothetical protein [Nocardia brasiliensis]